MLALIILNSWVLLSLWRSVLTEKYDRSISLRLHTSLQEVQALVQRIQGQQPIIQTEASQLRCGNRTEIERIFQMIEAQIVRQGSNPMMQHEQLTDSTQGSPSAAWRMSVPHFPNTDVREKSENLAPLMRFTTAYQKAYAIDCRCSCHRRHRLKSPDLFTRLLGSMFPGYANLPVFSPRCDTVDCKHQPYSTLWVDYYFPAWFLKWKMHISVSYKSGPDQFLRLSRIVAPKSDIIKFAVKGDVQRMKLLLQDGQGSPFDTD